MQRDFVEPGGFGETLGNDASQLRQVIPPLQRVLAATRSAGLTVIHTREGHRPDLSDCPPSKRNRGKPALRIGDTGPKGRILIRGEYGHGIIDELAPVEGETVIDKPGKGAFYATGLDDTAARPGDQQPRRHRRHHRGMRAHDGPGGQRPRLRVPGPLRLRGFLLSASSSGPASP